eukprot:TRINITY_DN62_c1_g1_i1.p1 TRINITY_DN62_c1_g1~~TRINITY_DN62_c1_g1_i1.p1  ORF type:complete len:471 (-),score=114.98 TRINITY_DN62_c1_g1_i1:125-1537(-)
MAEHSIGAKCAAEFLGTFLLVFTVGCNVLSQNGTWGGASIASVLMVSIYALGGISGANFNPAVSFTLGLTKQMKGPGLDWKLVGIYCAVQLLAGVCAGFAYFGLFGTVFNLEPNKGFGLVAAGACEFLYTFMLCFVVLNTGVSCRRQEIRRGDVVEKPHDEFFGLAIGFVIVAGAYGAGAVSKGCFNPAVATGIDLSSAHMGFGMCLAYVGFELAGAALAAVLFKTMRPEDFQGSDDKPAYVDFLSEIIGTYMLVLTVGLNVLGNSPATAYSAAAALMCMIYSLGDVSGAHFNPAVTVAILISDLDRSLTPGKAGEYILAQLIGGVAAGFTYSAIHDFASFPIGPVGNHTWAQVAVAEIIFTFLLCFVVLGAAVSADTKTTQFFGLAIGSCVTAGGFAIGGISGGSLNPAVSFGIAVAHATKQTSVLGNAAGYALLELCGAGLAAGVFKVTHAKPSIPMDDKRDAGYGSL